MKISIITVVFNGEGTIQKAIESVLSQQNIELEYIVIDGASQDGTLDKISPYIHKINFLISEEDSGIYDAINKGIDLANGEVIGILNSDDFYVSPFILGEVMEAFKDPELDALYGDLEYFRARNNKKTVRRYRSNKFSSRELRFGLMPAHPTLFLRRSVYERFGNYDVSYKIAGDYDFVVRIFKDQSLKFRYMPKVMVRMQMGGVSTSGLKSTILLLKENLRACHKNGISSNYFCLLLRYPKKLFEYIFLT